MDDLTAKTCVTCRGGIPPLSVEQAKGYLKHVPEWTLSTLATVSIQDQLPDFDAALDFVNKVGALCEAEGHHADITFGWGYADILFFTHKIKGLHENDFIMAAKIDTLL